MTIGLELTRQLRDGIALRAAYAAKRWPRHRRVVVTIAVIAAGLVAVLPVR